MAVLFGGSAKNLNELPEGQNFDLLPAGWYNSVIEKAELRDSKSGGQYLNFTYNITGPTMDGRKVFAMVNISCPTSQKAEEIGLGQLRLIASACGLAAVSDTDQFSNKQVQIKVGIQKGNGTYEDRNDVKAWKSMNASPLPGAATTASTTSTQSPVSSQSPAGNNPTQQQTESPAQPQAKKPSWLNK